jgi:hypothetical protein
MVATLYSATANWKTVLRPKRSVSSPWPKVPMNSPTKVAVPTMPIPAGVAKCVRIMSGTNEPRIMKSMTSKNNPAQMIASTRRWTGPITALSIAAST